MPALSLEEMLRSSLEGVNREFREADKALHEEVASTNDALSKISDGAVQVTLVIVNEGVEGVIYGFVVNANKPNATNMGYFCVTPKGFPIFFGQIRDHVQLGANS